MDQLDALEQDSKQRMSSHYEPLYGLRLAGAVKSLRR